MNTNNDIINNEKRTAVPGYGIAGLVLCPFLKSACQKSACELWVELKYEENFVARCSISWLAILNTEVTQAIIKLKPKEV